MSRKKKAEAVDTDDKELDFGLGLNPHVLFSLLRKPCQRFAEHRIERNRSFPFFTALGQCLLGCSR